MNSRNEVEYATELASRALQENPKSVGKQRSGLIEEACKKALIFYGMETHYEKINQLMSAVGRRLNARKKRINDQNRCSRSWDRRYVEMNLHICPID